MMQHGERDNSGKLGVRERHGSRVAGDYRNIGPAQARTQGHRQLGVDFDGRETRYRRPQQICGETRAWPKLKNILSQVGAIEGPRHSLLNSFSPARGTAQPMV